MIISNIESNLEETSLISRGLELLLDFLEDMDDEM